MCFLKLVLSTVMLASIGLAANPVIVWNCNVPAAGSSVGVGEVCDNMCWGIHCTSGQWQATNLNYDTPSKSTKDARRSKAGCLVSGNKGNRCAQKNSGTAGQNCDEFPFASVSNSDAGGQNIRCVTVKHNSNQGTALSKFQGSFSSNFKTPFTFDMAFDSTTLGSTKYCVDNGPGTCTNDGTIFVSKGTALASNPTSFTPRTLSNGQKSGFVNPSYRYMTRSGREIMSPTLFEVGRKVTRLLPRNITSVQLPNLLENNVDDLYAEEDEIVGVLE